MAAWNGRWCLCRITGDGASPDTAFRPKVAVYGADFQAFWGTRPLDGAPYNPQRWCIARVSAADAAPLQADPDVVALPAVALSATWGSLSTPQRQAVSNAALARFELDLTGIAANTTLRQILKALLDRHDPVSTDPGAFG